MKHAALRRLPLYAALALALVGSGGQALAQGAAPAGEREAALEARIAELERQVQQLLAREAAPPPPEAKPATPPAPPAPTPTITPGAIPGSTFTYGGFIKFDAMLSRTPDGEIPDSSVGRLLYLPGGIPVGAGDEGTDIDSHAQFSRFWFNVASTTEGGDALRGYLEFDLFGNALGNEVATNTYGVTVRHAFASWNRWLAGETWSNFQDVAALPDAVDFIGPTEGSIFVRQSQLRYTSGPWSFSVENKQTVLTPFRGNANRIVSDDGALPDFTLRYTHKGDWGHFGIAGLVRQLNYETAGSAIDADAMGYGISLSGKYNLGPKDDLRYMLTAGRGISRYIGLAVATDGVLDAGNDIDTVGATAGFIAWRHVFNPSFRTNVFYSRGDYDNDAALTGVGLTKSTQSFHVNAIWTPLPKLDLGVEGIWAERELESGVDGNLYRLHFHAKYSF